MRNSRATLRQLAFILIAIAALSFTCPIYFKDHATGYAVLDSAEVFAGKEPYEVGDKVHIFVVPYNADHYVEVYGPDDKLVTLSKDFPAEKPGKYTIKAFLSFENKTKEISSEFTVNEIEIWEED